MSAAAEKLALLLAKRKAREVAAASAASETVTTEAPASKALRELRSTRSTLPTASSLPPSVGSDVQGADGKESSEQTSSMVVADYVEEINRLRTQMTEMEQKNLIVQTELDTTRDVMGTQTTKHENECTRLIKDNENLQRQVVEWKEKTTTMETEMKRITDKNNELSVHVTSSVANDNSKTTNDAKRIAELEGQINELMDNLEMLTLDKEQLVVDNEMLQAQLDDLTMSSSQNATGNVVSNSNTVGSIDLTDENAKLREALRRLHQQSTQDKSEWDLLKQQCNDDRIELEALRIFKSQADQEMSDLRQAVDATGSYESIIESLTEKNLRLMQRTAELEVTVHDVEEQHELSEELDRQQRMELDILRRKLDSATIHAAEKDSIIKGLENKVEEFKKINEKFRHSGEELRTELNELRGQVTMSTAESQRARHRARVTASSHATVDRIRQTATTLQCQLIGAEAAKKQTQALYVRLFAVFGRCPLYTTEDPLVANEVCVVHTASMGAVVCQTAVNFLIECLTVESIPVSASMAETITPSLPPTTGKIATRSRASSKSVPVETAPATVNTTSIKLAKIVEKTRTQLLSKVLILLRATCLSWQCVGAVFVNTGDDNIKNSFHVDVTNIIITSNNLYHCFEQALAVIVTAQQLYQLQIVHFDEETIDLFTSTFEDQLESNNHLFTEVNVVANKLEHLLSAHMLSFGIPTLPPLRSFEELLQSNPTFILEKSTMIPTEPPPCTNVDHRIWILQQFHTACQLSYVATSSDLLIRVIHAQITVQSMMHMEEKTTTNHATLVSMLDLCTRLRTELSGIGLVAPSSERGNDRKHLILSRNAHRSTSMNTCMSEGIEEQDRQQAYGILQTMLQSLVACFTNLSHVVALSISHGEESTTMQQLPLINISPAQLRVCMSDIGKVKDCLITTNSGSSTPATNLDSDTNPFSLKMVHYACQGEEDVLWQLLLDHPSIPSHTRLSHRQYNQKYSLHHNDSSGNDRDWYRSDWKELAVWHERSQEYHKQLVGWEQAQESMTHQQDALQSTQRTLKERSEELRTALAANTEMQQILQSKTVAVPSSSSDGGQESLITSSTSSRRNNRRNNNVQGEERDGGEDVTHEKLQSEIKVLTTALSVLEIQFENAEKENKRLRNAHGTNGNNNRGKGQATIDAGAMKSSSDENNYDGMKMVSFVTAQSRIWRSLASHRLLTSMKPLPSFSSTLQSPLSFPSSRRSFPPAMLSSSEPSESYDGQETKNTMTDPLKTYRELRKLRSTIKVQQTKRNAPNNQGTTIATALTVCFYGQEKRRDRLVQFFT